MTSCQNICVKRVVSKRQIQEVIFVILLHLWPFATTIWFTLDLPVSDSMVCCWAAFVCWAFCAFPRFLQPQQSFFVFMHGVSWIHSFDGLHLRFCQDFPTCTHFRHVSATNAAGSTCWYWSNRQRRMMLHVHLACTQMYLHYLHLNTHELTFAGLEPLGPRVGKLWVARISADLGPSTVGSTTTVLAGFPDGAALWAYRTGCRCDARRHER